MGCRRVDRVILTHFDDDHINGVEHLLARMGAETLTIPKAEGGAALDRLLELAERYGMDVETVTEETHLPFGNGELTIFPPLGVSGSNELGLTVLASAGEHDFLITGDMERATEKKLIETYELPEHGCSHGGASWIQELYIEGTAGSGDTGDGHHQRGQQFLRAPSGGYPAAAGPGRLRYLPDGPPRDGLSII